MDCPEWMQMKIDGVPVEPADVPCRFGDGHAVARYAMSRGCLCFPDDREQDLCMHHADRATPLGTMQEIKIYDADVWLMFNKIIHPNHVPVVTEAA